VGTYSSIFIACPLLIWFTKRANARANLVGGQQNAQRTLPVTS
jgi:preprotein translocase subunit SecF